MAVKTVERMKSGIEGFDDLCGGGFIRNRSYLVSGTSGAGKTIFALQFLYRGAVDYEDPGIFIATEERPEHIRENVANFGWDIEKLEEENMLAIVDASSAKIGLPSEEKFVDVRPFDTRSLIDNIITIQEEINAKRAVLDSTTAIGFQIMNPSKIRVELLKIATTLEVLGLTSVLTCEVVDEGHISRFGVENFVTEGTVLLHYKRTENVRVRSLEIFKMRGTGHSTKLHPFDITNDGIVVHLQEEVYSMI